ncbi:metalloprotease [Tissierella creatinini]|nr:metalloprotease [Tissierella creatinini]TJX62377.1 metalloprotease [Soehngenia saccharolytica]
MRWEGRRKSSNVEDRRGRSAGGGGLGGFGGKAIGGGLGLIIIIIIALLGGDPGSLLGNNQITSPDTQVPYEATADEQEMFDFVSVVFADTEDIWHDIFNSYGYDYKEPQLVIFTDSVQSACGVAGSSTGPFYCPGDNKLYIDLSFYQELKDRFKAPGDFAMAYVVAHEVGHHVQTLLGVTEQLNNIRGQVSQTEYNQYSVRFELQADYLAGVWANHVQGMGYLEEGDLEEALRAANAIGDDMIQKQAQGYVVPDSFTHGTSEQRMRWFYKGFQTGNLDQWDTFNK